MDPKIQYAVTSDGVSIAYSALGDGVPLVIAPSGPWSNIQLELQVPLWRTWHEQPAQSRTVVRYDGRGTGLSEGSISDFSLDSQVLDIEAVVNRLGQGSVALLGPEYYGPATITYAVRYPSQVSQLILWCTYARATDYIDSSHIQALMALMNSEWDLFTLTLARARLSSDEGSAAHRAATALREGVTQHTMKAFMAAVRGVDVTDLLPRIKPSTLVIHRRQAHLDASIAKDLATEILDARLALLEGESAAAYLEDAHAVLRVIYEFLGENQVSELREGHQVWTAEFVTETLSQRELEVMRLLVSGLSNQEIAGELVIGVGTVKSHVHRIFGKLDVRSRTQASLRAREMGLL